MAGVMNSKSMIATEDRVLTQILQHGVEVQRKVFAGQDVPPDLREAYAAASKPAAKRSPAKGE